MRLRTLHEAGAVTDLVRRTRALAPGSTGRWGRMTVDQMLWHLNQSVDASLGRLAVTPKPLGRARPIAKLVALYGPWPKGRVPTLRELKAGAAHDLEVERERLGRLLGEAAARPLDGGWSDHGAFGPLAGREWSRIHWRHVDYHLKQFGV